jgi:hypothetical protein
MPLYKLKRPFDDGTVVHKRGSVITLDKDAPRPSTAVEVSAEEVAAAAQTVSGEEAVTAAAERATLKAELVAEILGELGDKNPTAQEDAKKEVEAVNAAASAQATGGVDNDGKPLEEATAKEPDEKSPKSKTPTQKAPAK